MAGNARHRYRAKLGTQPAVLVFDCRYKIEVGRKVRCRDFGHGTKWFMALVDRIDDEMGYIFLSR